MSVTPSGHIEELPSGSYRVAVYVGIDPITRKRVYLRETAKDSVQAQIVLGKLLQRAQAGKEPESGATVGQLLDLYMPLAEWDVSTRESFEGYVRRTIRPGLGHLKVRKQVHGPVLDTFYARLKKCGDLTCTGRPFIEHRNVPDLRPSADGGSLDWEQVADMLRTVVESGTLPAGAAIPSVRDLQAAQGIARSTLQRAFRELADEGTILVRQGRTAVVAGEPAQDEPPGVRRWRPGPGHDCKLAGCQRHTCRPMKPGTIRQIHSILSGAFDAAKRWKWVDENPAESAKPPTVTTVKRPATSPAEVAAVIALARETGRPQLALYVWLAAITGARRGELCAVQVCDIDLEHKLLHIAFNYLVKSGQKVRKDTKTHQDRWIALDDTSCALIAEILAAVNELLAPVGLQLGKDAYLFSNEAVHAIPWNPDWASHRVSDLADEAGVDLNIKKLRHYTASQLLAARFDLQNTAARLGHGGGGATTLKHYADPVSEVDRRAAAYLAELTGTAVSVVPTVPD
jgi:integrase